MVGQHLGSVSKSAILVQPCAHSCSNNAAEREHIEGGGTGGGEAQAGLASAALRRNSR